METAHTQVPSASRAVELHAALWPGLALLLQAYEYAQELGCDLWEFAVGAAELLAAGLTHTTLRRLVYQRYVEHAHETTQPSHERRCFRRGGPALFVAETCFALTPQGALVARQARPLPATIPDCGGAWTQPAGAAYAGQPRWDGARRALCLGQVVIKRFGGRPGNQERLLDALEEDGWPRTLDDPLPGDDGIDAPDRLRNTVKDLNRGLRGQALRFHIINNGTGISWSLEF
jgi:hypothetical protein